jgi:hypothetical protein
VPGAVQDGDEPAQGVAEHNGPVDAERIAEGPQVVGADLEAPVRRVVPRRPAVVAQVDIDDLRDGDKWAEVGLEIGMVVAARSSVHDDDRGALPHPRAVGHQRGSVDIEPQPGTVHADIHADPPSGWAADSPGSPRGGGPTKPDTTLI